MRIDNNYNFYQGFRAGMTKQMYQEIRNCDTKKVSDYLQRNNIYSDFKGNKVVAWCALKCTEIIKKINSKLGTRFALPTEIYVEDFYKLKANVNTIGLTNLAPTKLYINNHRIVPNNVIFFNEFKDENYKGGNAFWDNLDRVADSNYANGLSPTNFFLDTFLHEFAHSAHITNIIKKLGGENYIKTLLEFLNPNYLQNYQLLHRLLTPKICEYAAENPLETVACDLSKHIVEDIDKNELEPINNLVPKSPYFSDNTSSLSTFDKILKLIWEGKTFRITQKSSTAG